MYEILLFSYTYHSRTSLKTSRIGFATVLSSATGLINACLSGNTERIHHFEIRKFPVDVVPQEFIQSGIWILDNDGTILFEYPDFSQPFTGLNESEVPFKVKEIVEVPIKNHTADTITLVPAIVLSTPPLKTDTIFKKRNPPLMPLDETDCKYDVLLFEKAMNPGKVSYNKHSHAHVPAWNVFKCHRKIPVSVAVKLKTAYQTILHI